jgi:hypothetical protein
MDEFWTKLAAPFSEDEVVWRVQRLSADALTALVRPQLSLEAVLRRLNEAAGVDGWSNTYAPLGETALSCALGVRDVTRSVVVELVQGSAAEQADDGLVRAAERFGLLPPVDPTREYWVDYDPESAEMLSGASDAALPDMALEAPPPASMEKPAGQQAIDRLLERLKEAGLGREAARLVVACGGYGSGGESARELYGKLRALLLTGAAG